MTLTDFAQFCNETGRDWRKYSDIPLLLEFAEWAQKHTPTPSEQLQAELEPLPGSYPGKFHVG